MGEQPHIFEGLYRAKKQVLSKVTDWRWYHDAPGWVRDRFMRCEHHYVAGSSLEVREHIVAEAGCHSANRYSISVLKNSWAERPIECEVVGKRFVRPNVPGTLLMFRNCDVQHLQGHGPFHSQSLNLEYPELMARLEVLSGGRQVSLEHLSQQSHHDEGLGILIGGVLRACRRRHEPENDWEVQDAFDAVLQRLLVLAGAASKPISTDDQLRPAAVTRAIEYLHAHFKTNVKRDRLAEIAEVNPNYLSRLFHNSTGVTIKQYLLTLRIEHAKQLLRGDDVAIADVATQCGFSLHSHFSQEFRRQVGVSPRAYRLRGN
ncbi:AraC family transcriptional regulator [Bremerella sp. JC817]|uniref:helix-turn-helix domain-containing protein n=1 Tax=Bremerella sp. JC817 TaxID=3231756 RepID=UPI00345B4642